LGLKGIAAPKGPLNQGFSARERIKHNEVPAVRFDSKQIATRRKGPIYAVPAA
jgi:hypothetical protein